jgi:hypothetical protein
MPHLYLPSEHTDADLILAADVAAAVASADLYVTWTHDAGPGTPEVEAVVREESASPAATNPIAELFVALFRGVAAVWHALTAPPAQRSTQPRLAGDAGRPAGEPTV